MRELSTAGGLPASAAPAGQNLSNRAGLLPLDGLTPAYVYDLAQLERDLLLAARLASETSCHLLYSLKACSELSLLERIAPRVAGFSCSSLSEAKLARRVAAGAVHTIHLTSPGLRPQEIDEIAAVCDYVSLNSLSSWRRHGPLLAMPLLSREPPPGAPAAPLATRASTASRALPPRCGLRVNPQLSCQAAEEADERYDPCRRHSKLGVPLGDLAGADLAGVSGLHFHTACERRDLSPLLATVRHLAARLDPLLARLEWINLGGGYLFDEALDLGPLHEAAALLHARYGLQVFLEPGTMIVRRAGSLVASVLDIFHSDGELVAVLDTSVNHWPEILEFGFSPDVLGDDPAAPHRYLLAGCSCLAGDVFGDYRFAEPLDIGSRVVFENAGAYSLAKAHCLNGIHLPAVCLLEGDGRLELVRQFSFDEFARRCGVT